MSVASLKAMADRQVRYWGGGMTVTLRRQHSLLDPVAGAPPATLLLNGAHLLGTTTVNLRTSGTLAGGGRFPPGLRLTIAGQQYTAAADAVAASNLLQVTITSGLLAGAADGVSVTVEPYRDYTFTAMSVLRREDESRVGGTSIVGGEQDLVLSAVSAPTTPRGGDLLVLGGLPEEIELTPLQPGAVAIGWRARRGGRAA